VARQFNRRLVVVGIFLVAFGLYLLTPFPPFPPVITATGVASLVSAIIVLWLSTRSRVAPRPMAPAVPEDMERVEETEVAAPDVKFCRYCGAENKPDAVYCETCGREIEEL